MSSWLDLLSDAGPIRGVYGDEVPSLTGVTVHEICLHRDGPRAILRFDLPSFPSRPPKKWAAQEFNTAQVQLILIGIADMTIHGWHNNILADLSITHEGELIRTYFRTLKMELDIRSQAALVSTISAYRDGTA